MTDAGGGRHGHHAHAFRRHPLAFLAMLTLGLSPSAEAAGTAPPGGPVSAVLTYRRGLEAVVGYQASRGDLFPAVKLDRARMASREEKEAIWSVWKTFLDYELALDSLGESHRDYWTKKGPAREAALLVLSGAVFARYRWAMAFVDRCENDPGLSVFLNEPVPELGLPEGTYADLKLRFLNAGRAAEFAALEVALKAVGGSQHPELRAALEADAAEIWRMGRWKGQVLTARNALAMVKKAGFSAWFPVQAGVAEWMGDVKVWRKDRSLVSQEQIRAALPTLEVGDIFYERREWYLSNIGLPGFWPHAALFVGTPEERRRYFDDADVRAFAVSEGRADGDFEGLLSSRYPEASRASSAAFEGHAPRVLEAMSEGVVFTSLEHSAAADCWAALRPRLTKVEKARALLKAFHLVGRPYDFNFDFLTDDAIVCSELVYKAYAPGPGTRGIRFPLVDLLGRKVSAPNEMIRQWSDQYGTPESQLDLVLFLDGSEKGRKAIAAGPEELRASWKRPKWHVVTR